MKIGYTAKEACRIVNITYKQLNYWDKINLAKPSIAGARGRGSRRIYSFTDLICLRVTAKLKQEGISLRKIRRSVSYLSNNFPDQDRPHTDFVFLTDGEGIFVLTEKPDLVLDTLHDGQFALSLAVGRIVEDTRNRILSLESEEENQGHVFEVVIEPDEDRYHAYCPALRGCRTWGHSKAEAYQYIQEAVELYLEALIDDGEPIPGIGIVEDIQDIKQVIRVRETEKKVVA